MPDRLLADVVVVLHVTFLVLLASGSLLAYRRPKLLWLHVPALAWGLFSITVGIDCPLTDLEKHFLRLGGEPTYTGGFIDHYIDGELYPDRYSVVVGAAVGLAAVGGYLRLWTRHRNRRYPAPELAPTRSTARP